MNRSEVYKQLPPVFLAWFTMVLMPALQALPGASKHTERETRTIVEAADALLRGDVLGALMMLLGRLRAITSVVMPDGTSGGWAVAQHYEVLQSTTSSLLTRRDRANAVRDQRDALRVVNPGRRPPDA